MPEHPVKKIIGPAPGYAVGYNKATGKDYRLLVTDYYAGPSSSEEFDKASPGSTHILVDAGSGGALIQVKKSDGSWSIQ